MIDAATLTVFTGEGASMFGNLAREMFAEPSRMDFDHEVDGEARDRRRANALKNAGMPSTGSRLAWERVQR